MIGTTRTTIFPQCVSRGPNNTGFLSPLQYFSIVLEGVWGNSGPSGPDALFAGVFRLLSGPGSGPRAGQEWSSGMAGVAPTEAASFAPGGKWHPLRRQRWPG